MKDYGTLSITIGESIETVRRKLLIATLNHHDFDKKAAAATLGVSLKTIYNMIEKFGLHFPPGRL